MSLPPGEPPAGPWQVRFLSSLIRALLGVADTQPGRPCVLAIDGRGGSGKTTIAERIRAAVPGAAAVHTDDVAWNHSFFDWVDPLVRGVLEPIHQGTPVAYQPAKWREHFRAGAIFVPLGCPLVIVEGSGSGRRELMPWLDALVWVQSDLVEAERRCLVRDGASEEAKCFWSEWTAEELPFYAHQRPWERADSFVAGTPTLPHDARTEIVTSACSDVRGDP